MCRYVVQLAPETAQRFRWVGKSGTTHQRLLQISFHRGLMLSTSQKLFFSMWTALHTERKIKKKNIRVQKRIKNKNLVRV